MPLNLQQNPEIKDTKTKPGDEIPEKEKNDNVKDKKFTSIKPEDKIPENEKKDTKNYKTNENNQPNINLQQMSQISEDKIAENFKKLGDRIPETEKKDVSNYNN